jgi:digeranylgeranylglycerophospholipid reductase
MHDVAVIGGGPIGSRIACQLSNMGYSVAVLEKRARVGEKSCCTGIISRECTAAFSIPDEVIFRKCDSAKLFSPLGEWIQIYRPEIQVCIIKRAEFDRWMAGKAESAGAEYHLLTDAKNVLFYPDRVAVEAETEGITVHYEAKAVVLAGGFNNALIRHLGLGNIGYFVNGAQTEITVRGIQEVEVYFNQKIAPGFFAWIVPTDQEHCLIGLLSHHAPGLLLKKWLSLLETQRNIDQRGSTICYGSIPLRPLSRTYGERLLVVGDAAGQVKPTTGGGIYFGLLCADIATDTLNRALKKGDLSARGLSEYEHTWLTKLGHELKTEYYARRIYERLSDKQIEALFLKLKKAGLVESILRQDDFSFDWHGGLLLNAVKLSTASGVKRIFALPAKLFRG